MREHARRRHTYRFIDAYLRTRGGMYRAESPAIMIPAPENGARLAKCFKSKILRTTRWRYDSHVSFSLAARTVLSRALEEQYMLTGRLPFNMIAHADRRQIATVVHFIYSSKKLCSYERRWCHLVIACDLTRDTFQTIWMMTRLLQAPKIRLQ